MNLIDLTASQAAQMLRSREVSSRELTQAVLDRIAAVDLAVHAFVTVTGKDALAQADEVDKKIADGEPLGPLAGIPIALNDMLFKNPARIHSAV